MRLIDLDGSKPFRTTRPVAKLREGRNDWYRIQASAVSGGPTSLYVFDEVGYFGVTALDLIKELRQVRGDLEVHLNTPGGEVFDGIAIYNLLCQWNGSVEVIVDSLAASIGSVIAMAASPGRLRVMPTGQFMVHDGFGVCIGNEADMHQMADLLGKTSDNIASVYAERTGKPASYWRQVMREETWFSAAEAVDAGLADEVMELRNGEGGAKQVRDSWDLSVFGKRPPALGGQAVPRMAASAAQPHEPRAAASHAPAQVDHHTHDHPFFDGSGGVHSHEHGHDGNADHSPGLLHSHQEETRNAASVPYVGVTQSRHEPMTGPHAHDHGAHGHPEHDDGIHHHSHVHHGDAVHNHHTAIDPDGDGDDDTSAETDTDHDYWTADGRQIKPLPAPLSDILDYQIRMAAVDHTDWDAGRAWHAGAESDDPGKFYSGICAGRKDGDTSKQSSWALPHHYAPDTPPNADGVRNALSRLPQTNGLTNAQAAKAHLEAHMKQVNPEYQGEEDRWAGVFRGRS